jgi:ABC-type glutathione transport system ATPase component
MTVLLVKGLKAGYRTAPFLFQFPDLHVEKGQCLSIIGPTGCGKTTLLNALFQPLFPGVVQYNRGEILGRDLRAISASGLYSTISYMPQFAQNALNPSLFVRTHFRHVQRSLETVEEKIWIGWMDELKLAQDVLELFPYQLSGGMKQRLVLLLGFLKRPALYAVDEPSSGVDAITLKIMIQFLQRRKQEGTAFLMVSHEQGLVNNLSDNILFLEKHLCLEKTAC